MKDQPTIELSKGNIEDLSAKDILFAEYAENGAMGNAGGIVIHILKDNELHLYTTNWFQDKTMFQEALKLLLPHQTALDFHTFEPQETLFDYHYGGVGNHVFIHRNVKLVKENDCFSFEANGNQFHIHCTVIGVFNCVAYSLEVNPS